MAVVQLPVPPPQYSSAPPPPPPSGIPQGKTIQDVRASNLFFILTRHTGWQDHGGTMEDEEPCTCRKSIMLWAHASLRLLSLVQRLLNLNALLKEKLIDKEAFVQKRSEILWTL